MKNKETIYTLITVLGVVTIVTTLGFATNWFTHLTNAEEFILRLKSNCINNYKVVDGGFSYVRMRIIYKKNDLNSPLAPPLFKRKGEEYILL